MTMSLTEKGQLIAEMATAEDYNTGPGVMADVFWDVSRLFRDFESLADSTTLRSYATACDEAMRTLVLGTVVDTYPEDGDNSYAGNPVFDNLGWVNTESGNWTGQAADSFEQGIITPSGRVVPNQFLVVRTLKFALEAYASLWEETERSIHNIADKTLGALEVVGDKGSTKWAFGLTAAAAVVTVGVTIASGGTALPILLTVAAGFSSTAAAGSTREPPPEAPFGGSGDSGVEIVTSMRGAISQLRTDIVAAETMIKTGLSATTATLSGDASVGSTATYHFIEPQLVGSPDFGDHT